MHRLFLFIVSLSFLVLPLQAQEEAEASATMSPNVQDDLAVVVAATRGFACDPLDVPQSISVLTDETLQATVYDSVEDALHRLPNVGLAQASQNFSARQGASTSSNYWQEGFTIRGLGGPRVLVLTDGVRQVGHGIGYGGGNLALYDFYSIERIEVIRGPASVLYGTDAFGGVISITTKEPCYTPGFEAAVKSRTAVDGSRNLWRTGLFVSASDQNWAMTAGGSFSQASTPHAAPGTTADGGSYTGYGAWLKTDACLSEKVRLRFILNTTYTQDIEVAKNRVIAPAWPRLNVQIPLYQRSEAGVELISHDVNHCCEEVKLGFYWQGLHRHFNWQAPRIINYGPLHATIETQASNDRVNTFEFQPIGRWQFEPHTLIIGADIARDDIILKEKRSEQPFGGMPLPPPSPNLPLGDFTKADAYQVRAGFYAQDRWDCSPFELVLGGRFDAFHVHDSLTGISKNPTGFSGSASSIYHFNDCTSTYITLSSGFRAPDLGERFQNAKIVLSAPMTVLGNPELSPERAYCIEVGAKHRNDNLSFEGAIFGNKINDYIGLAQRSAYVWQQENLGNVFLYGLEGEVSYTAFDCLELYANGSRTFCHQYKLLPVPNWMFTFGTALTIDCDMGCFNYIKPEFRGMAGTHSKDTLNNVNYPGYAVFDIQVSFGLNSIGNLEGRFLVGLKNIFNKAYYTPFFGDPTKAFNAQPGRGGFASLEISF